MIIVAGHLVVRPDRRQEMLEQHHVVMTAARAAPGCLDFHLSADPLEPDRINVHERWESVAAVERFRGSGPDGARWDAVLAADVRQYDVATWTSLT